MTFTVTYRAKDGALREERVDAANRAECVAECRKRGIAPTGIREGGKGKGRDGARPSRVGAGDNKRTTARWVAAAVVLAAIVGGAFGERALPGTRETQSGEAERPRRSEALPCGAGGTAKGETGGDARAAEEAAHQLGHQAPFKGRDERPQPGGAELLEDVPSRPAAGREPARAQQRQVPHFQEPHGQRHRLPDGDGAGDAGVRERGVLRQGFHAEVPEVA